MNTGQVIHEYIYDKRRQLKGIWVASPIIRDPDIVNIGWALCNTNKGDRFDKKRAFEIALGRAVKISAQNLPQSLEEGYNFFEKRCKRYYKDKTVLNNFQKGF